MSWDAACTALNAACLTTFGETVTYTTDLGVSFDLSMVRCAPSQEGDVLPGRYLGLWARLADFTDPPTKGGVVLIDAERYTVVEVQKEESGLGVTLSLSKQS